MAGGKKKGKLVLFAAGLATAAAACSPAAAADRTEKNEELTVRFLKVGKADAIILQCGQETMVLDTGEEDDGQELVEKLEQMDADRVDCLIITHFDSDHVGGADTLIQHMPVDRICIPAYEGDGEEYRDFLKAMEEAGVEADRLTEAVTLTLGNAEVLIEPPASYEMGDSDQEYDNDFSLITTVRHEGQVLVFMGDAEEKRIREWTGTGQAEDCDLIKIPHHGKYDAALESLIEVTRPEYAVITCSKKNPPEGKTLKLLKQQKAEVFLTRDGDITVTSGGKGLEISQ